MYESENVSTVILVFKEKVLTREIITQLGKSLINSLEEADQEFSARGHGFHVTGTPMFDVGYTKAGENLDVT